MQTDNNFKLSIEQKKTHNTSLNERVEWIAEYS